LVVRVLYCWALVPLSHFIPPSLDTLDLI
jgi:hypothetical protein